MADLTKGWTWHGVLGGITGGMIGLYLSFGWHPFTTTAVSIMGVFGGTLIADLVWLVSGRHGERRAGDLRWILN